MSIAEKGTRKIAVEVKNYPTKGTGVVADFDRNMGPYKRDASHFNKNEPDRTLYQAIPKAT